MESTINQIGLNTSDAQALSNSLNKLLANYQVFYMNTRGFHWNIKGEKFFELHAKFEELYNDLLIKIDEIAERVLTLGLQPLHTYSDYLEHSEIKSARDISNGRDAVQSILDAFAVLLPIQRLLLDMSDRSGDEGTNALMSDYIREQEKLVWMYSAYLAA